MAFSWLGLSILLLYNSSSPQGVAFRDALDESRSSKTAAITLEQFYSIRDGMDYMQVAKILGSPGELVTESDVAGIHTAMFQWRSGIANMNVMFQDGRVVSKAQFGLK